LNNLKFLPKAKINSTPKQMLLLAWSPYCDSTLLPYITYFGNLEGDITLVDSIAQLCVTLHLCNASQQVGSIQTGEMQIVDHAFESCKHCYEIWKVNFPTQGQFIG
jgi:hypothetical protein